MSYSQNVVYTSVIKSNQLYFIIVCAHKLQFSLGEPSSCESVKVQIKMSEDIKCLKLSINKQNTLAKISE